ncbi:hypothetical protein [Phyllobacterium phragmitis]|nr:hypothetical protein [Phyllobacterium phragmitis]
MTLNKLENFINNHRGRGEGRARRNVIIRSTKQSASAIMVKHPV